MWVAASPMDGSGHEAAVWSKPVLGSTKSETVGSEVDGANSGHSFGADSVFFGVAKTSTRYFYLLECK